MKKLLLVIVLLSSFMVGCSKEDTYVGEYGYYFPANGLSSKHSELKSELEKEKIILKEDKCLVRSGDEITTWGEIIVNGNKILLYKDNEVVLELYYVNGFLCGKYDGEVPKGNRFNADFSSGLVGTKYSFTEDGKYTVSNPNLEQRVGEYTRKKDGIILTYEVNGETVNKEFIVKDNTLYDKVFIKEQ